MPLQRCTVNDKKGWRWGESGKCYLGPGGRRKALRQMRAIKSKESTAEEKHILHRVADVIAKTQEEK